MKSILKIKAVRYALGILGALLLLAVAIFAVFYFLFIPSIPDPDYPNPNDQVEAYRQDLDYLKGYADLDASFTEGDRKQQFLSYISQLEGQLTSFTPASFELAVARAVAFADNGHSNVSPIGMTRRFNRFPIRFGGFEDGIFVLQTYKENTELLGARVDSFGSMGTQEVVEKLIPYFGGRENRSRWFAPLNMGSPELLHALGIGESKDSMRLRFSFQNGNTTSQVIKALPPDEENAQPYGRKIFEHQVPKSDSSEWTCLMQGKPVPLYLRNPDAPYDHEFLEDDALVYIKINYNYDVNGISLSGYLKKVIQEMAVKKVRYAVVDLRFNGGGTDATAQFSKDLPDVIPQDGKIFVLTSAETFSAGIGAVATIKYYGKERVSIVGTPIGDRPRFWANGGTLMELPNSGLPLHVWSSLEDYGDGCWDWKKCFWLSPMFRKQGAGSLEPDSLQGLSFSEYQEGRDPVMEKVMRVIRD